MALGKIRKNEVKLGGSRLGMPQALEDGAVSHRGAIPYNPLADVFIPPKTNYPYCVFSGPPKKVILWRSHVCYYVGYYVCYFLFRCGAIYVCHFWRCLYGSLAKEIDPAGRGVIQRRSCSGSMGEKKRRCKIKYRGRGVARI